MREIVAKGVFSNAAGRIPNSAEAISAVRWALENNAEDYPVIPGYQTLRAAKTDPIRDIPALLVVFRITEEDKVSLEWIELYDPEGFCGPPLM